MSTTPRFPTGTFRPAPGRGRPTAMLTAQTRTELLLTLRNGEQILLTLLIPLALLIGLSTLEALPVPVEAGLPRVDAVTPRILALAVMSTAFTGAAIALGFDRRYGVLKRLAATALPRWSMITGRVLANLAVIGIQLVALGGVAALLGWRPVAAGIGWALLVVLLGGLAFGALGVLLGGSLRAEVVLALANAVWFVLLLAGGVVVPLDALPDGLAAVVRFLPSGALAEGLRVALTEGAAPAPSSLLVLLGWAVAAGAVAVRTTRLS